MSVRFPVQRALRALGLALLAACSGDLPGAGDPPAIGFIEPVSGGEGPRRGLRLGTEEAEHAGRLVGGSLRVLTERAGSPGEAEEAARRLLDRGAVALVGGFDDATCRALSELAERRHVLFLNVGCRDDALRRPSHRFTLHVEASEAMYDAAGGGAVLWHGGLSRYGAAQLNERFRREYGEAAEPSAWASWMAVKVVWEALQRVEEPSPEALADYLASAEASFDGHKGAPLRFASATRQLQQPLFPPASAGPAEAEARGVEVTAPADLRLGSGPYLFVSNEGSGDVTVIDLETRLPVARVPVGPRPRGIRVSPDGRRLYVALSDNAPTAESDDDAIAVVDLERGGLVQRHAAGSDPEQFAVSPDGRWLFAANEDAGTATVTDLGSGEEVATLVVGVEPEGVAASPDGRWVYVTAETSNTVSVIDTRANEVVASFLVDVRPRGVTFSPDGSRAYVTNEISGTVSVVDAREHRVVGTIPLGDAAKPVGVAVSPDGRRVYVANGHGHGVAVIDAATSRLIASVPTGRRPWGVALSADGRWIYTANGGSDDVSVIDAESLETVLTIPVGSRPWGVAVRDGR